MECLFVDVDRLSSHLLGNSSLTESILESSGNVAQVLHATSSGGLSALTLLRPVDYTKMSNLFSSIEASGVVEC